MPTLFPTVWHKETEKSFGEFLSLTLEILRLCHCKALTDCVEQIESESDFSSVGKLKMVVGAFQHVILCSLCTLTSLVNKCETESLFVVKRLLDITLKISSSQTHPSTASQSPSPIITASQSPFPIITASQSHPAIITASFSNDITPIQASFSLNSQLIRAPQVAPSSQSSHFSLYAIIHDCLNILLQNSALVSSFQFWMIEASISMQQLPSASENLNGPPMTPPHDITPTVLPGGSVSIESGLKYTVMRKAVLSLLEFVAIAFMEENGQYIDKCVCACVCMFCSCGCSVFARYVAHGTS